MSEKKIIIRKPLEIIPERIGELNIIINNYRKRITAPNVEAKNIEQRIRNAESSLIINERILDYIINGKKDLPNVKRS